jgi:hypothetical protein
MHSTEQVDVPQRPAAVARLGDEVADDLLERGAVAGRRNRPAMQMQVDVEVGVVPQNGPPSSPPSPTR